MIRLLLFLYTAIINVKCLKYSYKCLKYVYKIIYIVATVYNIKTCHTRAKKTDNRHNVDTLISKEKENKVE